MKDKRFVRYNVDFVFRGFKYKKGAVSIDLSDLENMKGVVEADWSVTFAQHHLKKVLAEATGIKGGWDVSFVVVDRTIFSRATAKYRFTVKSRLYVNLRKIYERPTRNERPDDDSDGTY